MRKNLIQTGNSKALIMSKDMRDHLGITDAVEVQFRKNTIVLRNPDEPDEDEAPKAKSKAKKGK
jgi:antitoxin component of MazEF toxin-antitoxin module